MFYLGGAGLGQASSVDLTQQVQDNINAGMDPQTAYDLAVASIPSNVTATVSPSGGSISGGGTATTLLSSGQTATYNPSTGTFTVGSTLPSWLPWALGGAALVFLLAASGRRR